MTISKEKLKAYLDQVYEFHVKEATSVFDKRDIFREGIIYQVTMLQNLLESGYFNKEKMQWHAPINRFNVNCIEREFCDYCISCNTYKNCDTCKVKEGSKPTNFKEE